MGKGKTSVHSDPENALLSRDILSRGDLETTNRILGRPFQVRGTVIRGDGRGNTIGFPTANLEIDNSQALPRYGVYAVMAGVGSAMHPGVCNIGVRPTFEAQRHSFERYWTVKSEGIERFDALQELRSDGESSVPVGQRAFQRGSCKGLRQD